MIKKEEIDEKRREAIALAKTVTQKIATQREVRLDEKTVVYSSDLTTPMAELRQKLIKKFKLNQPVK